MWFLSGDRYLGGVATDRREILHDVTATVYVPDVASPLFMVIPPAVSECGIKKWVRVQGRI